MFRSRTLLIAAAMVTLGAVLAAGLGAAAAQEPVPLMKLDLIVPATGYLDGRVGTQLLCVALPEGASSVTLARHALVDAAGTDRPLTVTIRPYASTAYPLIDDLALREPVTLTVPGLGLATCFSFENPVSPEQAAGVAQAYKWFAQVVTIEVR